jgi:plastocyanin
MILSMPAFIRRLMSVLAILFIAEASLSPEALASSPVTDIAFQSSPPYYEPAVAVVPMGAPIRWVNTTASFHSVRHDACVEDEPCPFQSIAIPPDSSFVVAPLPPGRYSYHCELHPIMRGTLLVIDAFSTQVEQERHNR